MNENEVLIYVEPFDSFVFPDDYRWSLAFYKLCAIEKMVTKYDYDNYVYTDADIFVQNSLDNVFLELRDHILMYDINHGLFVPNYRGMLEEFKSFGVDEYITQYGGEFFAASRENAKEFITICKSIYDEMQSKKFITTKGDEFISSIAASRIKCKIKNAGAYVFRFWTGSFYLVSTCFKYNEIAILHLPSEKQRGMLKLFKAFEKKQKFPRKEKVYRICHLNHKPLKNIIIDGVKKVLSK